MSVRLTMQAMQIANFVFSTRSTAPYIAKPFGFYSGNELDIGRDLVQSLLDIEDTSISKHHIRISSIEFDEVQSDEADAVNPLVYMQVLSKNGLTIYNSCAKPIQSHKLCQGTSRLLNHGDVLILSPGIMIMVTLRINCDRDGFTSTNTKTQPFGNYRLTSRIIRTGGFARVVLASNVKTGQQLACKIISGVQLSSAGNPKLPTNEQDTATRYLKLRIRREIDIASHLDHPHIVKVHETFQYQQCIYIFQDLATGGDLTSYLTQHGPLDQAEVILIAYQLAHAVRYLHQNGIAHRDLKPENILRSSSSLNSRITLADFGQARQLSLTVDGLTGEHVARMESQVGTYGWQAPEMRKSINYVLSYSQAIDIWSMGGVVVALYTNELPSSVQGGRSNSADSTKQINFTSPVWQRVSEKGKAYICDTMAIDEHKRINADQALQHAWFHDQKYATDLQRAYRKVISDWKSQRDGSSQA